MMAPDDVIEIVARLDEAGLPFWLDGGWGVDTLVGEETRTHDDLDLVVELASTDRVIEVLTRVGFQVTLDERPTRFVLADGKDRRIDFHPIVLDDDGNGRQIGAGPNGGDAVYPADGLNGQGTIAGHFVPCLTPELLLAHHTGYEPQQKDRHNVRALCERFNLQAPRSYLE